MIQNLPAGPELQGTLAEDLIHFSNFGDDFPSYFLRLQAFGARMRWRFPAGREKAKPHHDEGLRPILPCGLRSHGVTGGKDAAETFDGSRIGQIQMLEDLGRRPFLFRVPGELLGSHPRDRRSNFPLQSSKVRLHECHLPFLIFRIECFGNNKIIQLHQEGLHEDG